MPISGKYSQNLFEILLAFLVMILSILNVSDIPLLLLFSRLTCSVCSMCFVCYICICGAHWHNNSLCILVLFYYNICFLIAYFTPDVIGDLETYYCKQYKLS